MAAAAKDVGKAAYPRAKSIETTVQEQRARANGAIACLVVSAEYGLSPDEVLHGGRTQRTLPAYRVAIYLSCIELRSTQSKVAAVFETSAATVRRAIQWVEDQREDVGEFEDMMQRLSSRACPVNGGTPRRYG